MKKGDAVGLVATARAVDESIVEAARNVFESWGLRVVVPDDVYAQYGQLAGDDNLRACAMQSMLDDDSVRAVVALRGGYGTVRIIDRLDFSRFMQNPKWLVGYSDFTVMHCHLQQVLGVESIHAVMPVNFPECDDDSVALCSLRRALFGEADCYEVEPSAINREGTAEGVVVGGNLSVIYSLLGSVSAPDTRGKILLVEDLDEYIYHIDRMMQNLLRNGMLDGLQGLIVGGLTQMHDNAMPFGRTARQVVRDAVERFNYPVLFDAPFGHIGASNRALLLGSNIRLESSTDKMCHITPVAC